MVWGAVASAAGSALSSNASKKSTYSYNPMTRYGEMENKGRYWGDLLMGGGLGLFAGKKEEEEGGYDIVQMPQYSYSEPMLQQTSDFLTGSLSNLQEGRAPAYYENALPELKAGMTDPLYKKYFGRPGERAGILEMQKNLGAQAGVGQKNMQSQTNKAFQNYADEEAQIDAFFTKMGVDIRNQAATNLPNQIMSMPRGPETQIVTSQGGIGGSSGGGGEIPNIPWESLFSNNQPQQSQQQSSYIPQSQNWGGGTQSYAYNNDSMMSTDWGNTDTSNWTYAG